VDLLKAGSIQLVIYTATGAHSFSDEQAIRRATGDASDSVHHDAERARAAAEGVASRRRDRSGCGACRRSTRGLGKEFLLNRSFSIPWEKCPFSDMGSFLAVFGDKETG